VWRCAEAQHHHAHAGAGAVQDHAAAAEARGAAVWAAGHRQDHAGQGAGCSRPNLVAVVWGWWLLARWWDGGVAGSACALEGVQNAAAQLVVG
jgi:hypothetical protein